MVLFSHCCYTVTTYYYTGLVITKGLEVRARTMHFAIGLTKRYTYLSCHNWTIDGSLSLL